MKKSTDLKHLKSVSRSFYTSLVAVPATVRPLLGIGYLLCRAADSLADTNIVPEQQRRSFLVKFRGIFESFPTHINHANAIFEEIKASLGPVETSEKKLTEDLPSLFQLFLKLSKTDQALIGDVVRSVCDGMIIDLDHFHQDKKLIALKNSVDLETYISLIGGEPGRFWTRACLEHIPNIKVINRAQWIHTGIEFGKGLQMINILRDLPRDLKMGRCYIPEDVMEDHKLKASDLLGQEKIDLFLPLYHNLIDQTLAYLKNGLLYILMLPRAQMRLRFSVWLPLIIGVRTLALLRVRADILDPKIIVKIPRKVVLSELVLGWVKVMSNEVITKEYGFWERQACSHSR